MEVARNDEPQDDFLVKVRVDKGIQEYLYNFHPFDVVGWDGYYYPWIFNINDFNPLLYNFNLFD